MSSGLYDRILLPRAIDLVCSTRAITRQRAKVVPLAAGRVLEIGIGTGLNLEHYDGSKVEDLVAIDPGLHPLAAMRAKKAGIEVELLPLSAESIPADSRSFDSVVVTYTLCTIPDVAHALREIRRVIKDEGKLLFCEHGRAEDASVHRWQDRIDPYWSPLAGGCHLNRPIAPLLNEAGFDTSTAQSMYLPGPRFFGFNTWGEARPL